MAAASSRVKEFLSRMCDDTLGGAEGRRLLWDRRKPEGGGEVCCVPLDSAQPKKAHSPLLPATSRRVTLALEKHEERE
jgi:hypothetical protein